MKRVKKEKSKKFSRREKIKQRKITKVYFFVAGVLAVFLIYLVINSFGGFDRSFGPEKFDVVDECSLIMGNIIHNMRDEGDCKIKCENNCDFREMDYLNSSFTFKETSCHTCECWCK